jgi:hypothetical protein
MVVHDTKPNEHRLKVTAGPDYDPKTHQVVPVNGETIRIESEHAIISLCVRIQDYTGERLIPSKSPLLRAKLINKQAIPRIPPPQVHISTTLCTKKTYIPFASR